jgi:insulysin
LAIHLNAQATSSGLEQTAVTSALEKDLQALGLKDTNKGEAAPVKEEINRTTPYVITDVRDFRCKLQISAGPQAVKHISEFEELDSKL